MHAPTHIRSDCKSYTYSPTAPAVGQAVSFDGRGSSCQATPCTYRWEDGATVIGSGSTLTHSFSAAGSHQLKLTVTDAQSRVASTTKTITVSEPAPAPSGDLALNKTVSASSFERAGFEASFANDGDSSTRWSSAVADNQWWQVDLGATYTVNAVELNWEVAYASSYKIQVSSDGSTFTDVASVTLDSARVERTEFPATTARYVRVLGLIRATPYGLSFWDARVEGKSSAAPTWSSGFETGDFSEWTWVDWPGGFEYATNGEIPAHTGNWKAHFEVTQADVDAGNVHSKLYKQWAIKSPETGWKDDFERPLERLPGDNPSGTYVSWMYYPTDYSQSASSWTNVFQFKEGYLDALGNWQQDPQWFLNTSRADGWGGVSPQPILVNGAASRGDAPVMVVNRWDNPWTKQVKLFTVPLGRWFEVRAELYQGDRIDWFIDGVAFDTSPASEYPVGTSARSTSWTFGPGHYGGVGKLWVDDVSFTAR